jgi:hypothetical protein
MMDYAKTREGAMRRQQELISRQKEISSQIRQLEEELTRIRKEMVGLEQIIEGLEFMSKDASSDLEGLGFTDQIRSILTSSGYHMTATQVRDTLMGMGVTGSSPKTLLISVHTVLGRISDELDIITTTEGKPAYKRKFRSLTPLTGSLRNLGRKLTPPSIYDIMPDTKDKK